MTLGQLCDPPTKGLGVGIIGSSQSPTQPKVSIHADWAVLMQVLVLDTSKNTSRNNLLRLDMEKSLEIKKRQSIRPSVSLF